jgi:hypothetical protein
MVGSSGHKGISRIDSVKNNTHGWYVRVQYRGQTHAKFFSDTAHGGQKKALGKAVKHRNQMEKELGKPRTDRTVTVGTVRNNSGVQGIKRILKGKGYAYEITWSPQPGVIQRTTVSIRKYGEEEAFRRAVKIRQQKEKEFFGGLITHDWPDTPPEVENTPIDPKSTSYGATGAARRQKSVAKSGIDKPRKTRTRPAGAPQTGTE